MPRFSYRGARSAGLTMAISLVIVVETFALHALTMRSHPVVAWVLTASSLSVLAWLVRDYRAMGTGAVEVTPTAIDARIGRRMAVLVERSNLTSAIRPTFRDLPQPGIAGAEYINLMKHLSPNVLLTLQEPVTVTMGGFITQPARRIAMHLDEPDAFLAALRTERAGEEAPASAR